MLWPRRVNDDDGNVSSTKMGRFGTPRWVKPNSVHDQQLIQPLDGALRSLLTYIVTLAGILFKCNSAFRR